MTFRLATSTVLVLLTASASADDSLCALQVASNVENVAKPSVDRRADCPLPAKAKWCQVHAGHSHDAFYMAVYESADAVSDCICKFGTWELVVNDVTDLGTPGHALDIGANVGFYSLVLAAAGWTVTAFEPMAGNSELIEASLCANPAMKSRVTLNRFGLGGKDDHCIVISDDNNLGDGISQCGDDAKKPIQAGYSERASIDLRRLDDVLSQQKVDKVDFVKMDVEGFECQVMSGGQSLLSKYRPRLIQSEVWPKMQGCLPEDYLASFAKASYSVSSDKKCASWDLDRPTEVVNRYMCEKPEQNGLSLLQTLGSIENSDRAMVWLKPDELP